MVSGEGEQTHNDFESDGKLMRKVTSFLTLNRYNKIYTQEFKEEDIEIMNINSKLKHSNNKLEKLAFYQVVLVFLGFFLFLIDVILHS